MVASSRIPIVSVIPGSTATRAPRVAISNGVLEADLGEERAPKAGGDGGDRCDHCPRVGSLATENRDSTDHEADNGGGEGLAPASSEDRSHGGPGEPVCGDDDRPRPVQRPQLGELVQGCGDGEPSRPDPSDEVVEPADEVEIDRLRRDADRRRPLVWKGSDRDLEQCRGGGDRDLASDPLPELLDPALQIVARKAGAVGGAGEPEQELVRTRLLVRRR